MPPKLKWITPTKENCLFFGMREDFSRFSKEIAEKVSPGVAIQSQFSAGGRLRFKTNSKNIALRLDIPLMEVEIGFDLYRFENGSDKYCGTFRKGESFLAQGSYDTDLLSIPEGNGTSFTLNFPPYAQISSVQIGIDEDASFSVGDKYCNSKPVVIYGSSITHGAYASRAGMTYPAQISQKYNIDFYNFGFGGNAKGEQEMYNFLASLEMSAFVSDLDHNLYDPGQLEARHLPLYTTIREKHPDVPYVIITRPDYHKNPKRYQPRMDIIKKTYDYALSKGDKNVYFIEGRTLYGDDFHNCTKDGTHPNDLGFYRMASVIGPVVAKALLSTLNKG